MATWHFLQAATRKAAQAICHRKPNNDNAASAPVLFCFLHFLARRFSSSRFSSMDFPKADFLLLRRLLALLLLLLLMLLLLELFFFFLLFFSFFDSGLSATPTRRWLLFQQLQIH